MFNSARFYIIIGLRSLIIKKEGENSENIIEFQSFIPNVPFYYHFFDEDKSYTEDLKGVIKELRIRNAAIIIQDDAIDIEVDKKVLTEFFMMCGVKKVQVKCQCFLLSLDSKKYISISRTSRVIVLRYITDNKSVVKKYYDKNYADIDQVKLDVKNLHADCYYESIPIFINNINKDMERFEDIGTLVSLKDIVTNIMNSK